MKYVILALLATYAYGAATAATACSDASVPSYTDADGVCRYCHPMCKTCDKDGCLTCHDASFTLGSSAPKGCDCASGKFIHQNQAGVYKCLTSAEVDTDGNHTKACPWGYGQVLNKSGGKKTCIPCKAATKGTCKECTKGTPDETQQDNCSTCFDGTTTNQATCPPTSGSAIVQWYGELTAANAETAGYYAGTDALATACKAGCTKCTSATACTACATGQLHDATAKTCTACKANEWVTGDPKACTAVFACTEVNQADGKCNAKKCDKTKNVKEEPDANGKCVCADTHEFKAGDAKATVDAEKVDRCVEKAKCDPACQANETCEGTTCKPKAASACTDAATAKTGCDKCAKNGEVWECTACVNTTTFELKDKKCQCMAKHVKHPDQATCYKCPDCSKEATKKNCNIKADKSGAECSETDGTANGGSGSGSGSTTSNGILISAFALVSAIILA